MVCKCDATTPSCVLPRSAKCIRINPFKKKRRTHVINRIDPVLLGKYCTRQYNTMECDARQSNTKRAKEKNPCSNTTHHIPVHVTMAILMMYQWNETKNIDIPIPLSYIHMYYIYIYSVVCFCFFWIIMCVARELGWIIIFGLEYFFLLWLCESSFWLIQKAVKTNLLMIRGYLVLAVFPEECIPWVFLASLEMLIFE